MTRTMYALSLLFMIVATKVFAVLLGEFGAGPEIAIPLSVGLAMLLFGAGAALVLRLKRR